MPFGKSLLPQHMHPFEPEENRAKEREQETKRLFGNAVLQERNLYEEKYGFRPRTLQVEQLLDAGGAMEDSGQYDAAVRMYQKALVLEPQHHELRKYIELLNVRLNAYAVMDKQKERQKSLAQHMDSSSCQHATLAVPSVSKGMDRPRGRAGSGPPVPLSPAAYGAELRKQAAQQAQNKAAAKKQEEQLDRLVLDTARDLHQHRMYHEQVSKVNQELQHNMQYKAAMEERRQQRVERYFEEHQGPAGAGVRNAVVLGMAGPLQGLGERQRAEIARNAVQQQQHPTVPTRRPYSAGGGGGRGGMQPQGQVALYNKVCPVRPSSAMAQYRQHQQHGVTASSSCVVRTSKVLQAPFARPAVDHPVAGIDPKAVRARQQAFLDKHRKKS